MSELLLQFQSTGSEGWCSKAYSRRISGKGVLGQIETSKNQQSKKNV